MERPLGSAETCTSPDDGGGQMLVGASAATRERSVGSAHVHYLRRPGSSRREQQPAQGSGASRRAALGGATERRRLERDLYDGVQNELVALIIELSVFGDVQPPAARGTTAACVSSGRGVEAGGLHLRLRGRGLLMLRRCS